MTTKTKTAFVSYSPNLQVVVRAGYPEAKNIDGSIVREAVTPIYADFRGNRLETDDKDIINYLRAHADFNQSRGFWEEGAAPDEPKPTRTDQQKAIAKAAADGDVEELNAILAGERETHDRPDVVMAAETWISTLTVGPEEMAGAEHRKDLPSEEGGLPKVDPVAELTDEQEREKVRKSAKVAAARAAVAGDDKTVEAQLDAERDAETAAQTEKAGAKSEGKASSKSPAKKKNDGDSGSSKK